MFKKLLLAASLMAASAISSAAFISGQFDFAGSADLTRTDNAYETIETNFATTVIATGDYANYINLGDTVAVVSPWTASPQEALWSVGGFSFDLNNIVSNDATTVSGTGFIRGNGFDDTYGQFSFTSQHGESGTFAFSATTVSEPMSVALLGLGLAGLVATRRKKA